MRPDTPYFSLRLRALTLNQEYRWDLPQFPPPLPEVLAALADTRLQPTLTSLELRRLDLSGATEPLADALSAREHLRVLEFRRCTFSPATLLALAPVISRSALTWLKMDGNAFVDEAGVMALGRALRELHTLTSLSFCTKDLLCPTIAASCIAAVMCELEGHHSLRELDLSLLTFDDRVATAAALAALLAANAPALTILNLRGCGLREDGLGLLCDALPSNTHLRELDISMNQADLDSLSVRLLLAVRANTGLRTLCTRWQRYRRAVDDTSSKEVPEALLEVQRILSARRDAHS